MKPFDFDTTIERRDTCSLKWERYRDRDILPLWVADMDFKAPPAVLDALRQRNEPGVYGYTIAPDDLAALICDRLEKRYAWAVAPEAIVWLPGVVSGFLSPHRSQPVSESRCARALRCP